MTKPILTFFIVFLLLGGIFSSAGDVLSELNSGSRSEFGPVSSTVTTATNGASVAPTPDTATMLLIATGLIGLAAVSRRKN